MNMFGCCGTRMGRKGAEVPVFMGVDGSPSTPGSMVGASPEGGGGAAQCGLGIAFKPDKNGSLHVKRLIPGGPAETSKLVEIGDVLRAVDGVKVNGMNRSDVAKLLMGAEGTRARLTFVRTADKPGGGGSTTKFVDCVVERRVFDELA